MVKKKVTTKKPAGVKVCCEECIHFQEPKFDIPKFKYTPAECLQGMKLVYEPPSTLSVTRGKLGFTRICSKFSKKG